LAATELYIELVVAIPGKALALGDVMLEAKGVSDLAANFSGAAATRS
jgi:hypothetical protein